MNRRTGRAALVMWSAVAVSGLVLVALSAWGWGARAWTVAGAVLLVSCIGVCLWAAAIGERSSREVRRAVDRLAATRRGSRSGGSTWPTDSDDRST